MKSHDKREFVDRLWCGVLSFRVAFGLLLSNELLEEFLSRGEIDRSCCFCAGAHGGASASVGEVSRMLPYRTMNG